MASLRLAWDSLHLTPHGSFPASRSLIMFLSRTLSNSLYYNKIAPSPPPLSLSIFLSRLYFLHSTSCIHCTLSPTRIWIPWGQRIYVFLWALTMCPIGGEGPILAKIAFFMEGKIKTLTCRDSETTLPANILSLNSRERPRNHPECLLRKDRFLGSSKSGFPEVRPRIWIFQILNWIFQKGLTYLLSKGKLGKMNLFLQQISMNRLSVAVFIYLSVFDT